MNTTHLNYRPAFEYPPPRTAVEQGETFRGWAIAAAAAWQAVPPALSAQGFNVPQGSWARLDSLTFSSQAATAAYLTTPGTFVAFQLTRNGIAIAGYDNIVMPAPQSDGISTVLQLPATLVIQPGTQQSIKVNVYNATGGNLLYVSAFVHGWTWTDQQDKQWRSTGQVS